jgi:hypothetical protein
MSKNAFDFDAENLYYTGVLCFLVYTIFLFNFSDEKKPSLQEIASERSIAQRATGWKIHHVAAQLDELVRDSVFIQSIYEIS